MDYNKIEDSIFKKAMEIFREGASEFFNLDIEIDRPAETEIKNVNIRTNAMDYLFYTKDKCYLHFEFQTTKKHDDLSRFLYYDSSLYYKSRMKITTIVVYSSDIKETENYIDCGSIEYNVKAFYMKNLDGDKKLEGINNKIKNGMELTEQDIMTLSFIPLMNTKKSKGEITLESIETASKIEEQKDKNNCLMLLYALFDKFGDEKSKRKFKEVVEMTEVGKMIYDEAKEVGIEQGIKKGKEQGKAELLLKLLIKKFKVIPDEYREKIKKLNGDTIEIISTDIFDMQSIEELEKYFN